MRVSVETAVLGAAVSAAVSAAATLWLARSPLLSTGDVRRAGAAGAGGAEEDGAAVASRGAAPALGGKAGGGGRGAAAEYAPEIVDEQQARTRAFLKPEGLARLRGTTVAVVGAGGVGSALVVMLVRSGVGRVIVIDFDQVSLSSLNRHACATLEDVGTPKVACLAKHCRRIAPWVEVVPVNRLWDAQDGPALLAGADYVADCIDNIATKVDLLAHCVTHGIQVVSSMGAGAKADPTRIAVADISATYEDPLSRSVRVLLRERGINGGIPAVYSTEKPGKDKAKLLDIEDAELRAGDVGELSILKDFRVRIMPVLSPLPALFGLTMATHLLCTISGYASVYDPVQGGYSLAGKQRAKLYDALVSSINAQFARLKLDGKTTHISAEEAEYLIEEIWRGKTLNGEYTRQKLTIWDPEGPYNIHNMVPVTRDEQARHEQLVLRERRALSEVYSSAELAEVQGRFELDRWYQHFRVN